MKCFNCNLEKLLNAIFKKYAFLMGDYNVNTVNERKSATTHIHDFSNILSTYYYHKLINIPTREHKQSSTLHNSWGSARLDSGPAVIYYLYK